MTGFQDVSGAFQASSGSLSAVLSGTQSLFGISSDLMKYVQMAAAAASLMSGVASGYQVLMSVVEAKNTIAAAKAAALTAANATNPIGWGKIALAAAAFSAAAVVTAGIMEYTLKGDTESTVGRSNIVSSIEGMT